MKRGAAPAPLFYFLVGELRSPKGVPRAPKSEDDRARTRNVRRDRPVRRGASSRLNSFAGKT